MTAAPFPTQIEYTTDSRDGFGEPKNVSINGQLVTAVKRIEIDQEDGDYNTVILTFRGVRVVSNPEPKEA